MTWKNSLTGVYLENILFEFDFKIKTQSCIKILMGNMGIMQNTMGSLTRNALAHKISVRSDAQVTES